MRCKACDKILSDIEMVVTNIEIDDSDMCTECISASFSKYNCIYDKEYHVHSDKDHYYECESDDY